MEDMNMQSSPTFYGQAAEKSTTKKNSEALLQEKNLIRKGFLGKNKFI